MFVLRNKKTRSRTRGKLECFFCKYKIYYDIFMFFYLVLISSGKSGMAPFGNKQSPGRQVATWQQFLMTYSYSRVRNMPLQETHFSFLLPKNFFMASYEILCEIILPIKMKNWDVFEMYCSFRIICYIIKQPYNQIVFIEYNAYLRVIIYQYPVNYLAKVSDKTY